MEKEITKEQAKTELEGRYTEAKKLLNQPDKLEELLQKFEQKIKKVPKIGEKLSHVFTLASMVKSYIKNEYKEVPLFSIVSAISAILYFVAPIDIINDLIPVVGYVDDAAVIACCVSLIDLDIQDYIEWRKSNGKDLYYQPQEEQE